MALRNLTSRCFSAARNFCPSSPLISSLNYLPRSTAPMAMAMQSTWTGNMTQEDFMLQDECILVDDNDAIVGHSNKKTCHVFDASQPRGILHRAFSVFLFNADGRLLLQQRAKHKITFPAVWTNTCCSHPLYGQDPNEVDQPEDVADGSVMGIKAAAVRKLEHELGIPPNQLPLTGFKFLTRLHYCAADTHTWGPNAEWGEHEMDYILFIQAKVDLKPNPEEVDDTRYVTAAELKQMMSPDSGLLWSPWFRIIAEKFLDTWWSDLEPILTQDKHRDVKSIHHIL